MLACLVNDFSMTRIELLIPALQDAAKKAPLAVKNTLRTFIDKEKTKENAVYNLLFNLYVMDDFETSDIRLVRRSEEDFM